jgi:hypothetical protein
MAALAGLVADGAILETPTLILLTGEVPVPLVGQPPVWTEATFTGYAPVANLTFGPPIVRTGGVVEMVGDDQNFVLGPTATEGQTITGWAIVNAAKTVLYSAGVLPQAVPLVSPGDGLNVQPVIRWGA